MAISVSPVRWAAGLGVAVAVGSAVLLPGLAGAQPRPPRVPDSAAVPVVRCGGEGVEAGARPIDAPAEGAQAVVTTTARPSDAAVGLAQAVFATTKEDFAADLARALGMSTAEVERAIAASQPTAPAIDDEAITIHAVAVTNDPDVLEAVAEQLDVTVEDLAAAVEATIPGCPSGPDKNNDPGIFSIVSIGRDGSNDMFEVIAEELGDGITADEVRDAFEAAQPASSRTAVAARPAVMFDVNALADALGITVEELEEAMESIMPRPQR